MSKKKFLPLLLVLALGLGACGNKTEEAPEDNTEQTVDAGEMDNKDDNQPDAEAPAIEGNSDQKEAGEKDAEQYLNTFYVEEPTTLNSALNSDASSWELLKNLMEPLVRNVENVETGELTAEPAAAESWEVSEDGLTWTFKIREGMKWSDGDPVTAKDYEFGIRTALDSTTGAGGMGWLLDVLEGYDENGGDNAKESVTATDDYTLEFKLKTPTPFFLQLASTRPTLPIKQSAYEEFGDKYGAEAANFVGNGPFIITDWVHQTEVKLEKNPEYWDADNVYFENVNWRIINEEATMMNAFQTGEIDSVSTNKAEYQAQFAAKPDVLHHKVNRPAVDFMFFNTEKAPYDNAKVRLAFSLALDREEAILGAYNEVGIPGYGFVMHGINTDQGEEYRSVVEGPIKALQEKYPDPKALLEEGLAEAGMTLDEFQANLDFGGVNEDTKKTGDYLINSFQEKLGITINVNMNEWAAFNDQIQNGSFDIGYMAWFADFNDPYHMLSLMLSGNDGVHTGWENKEYDKLVEEGLMSKDPAERLKKYEEAETLLSEEAPVIPIIYGERNSFIYDYLYGWQLSEFSTQGMKYQFTSGRE